MKLCRLLVPRRIELKLFVQIRKLEAAVPPELLQAPYGIRRLKYRPVVSKVRNFSPRLLVSVVLDNTRRNIYCECRSLPIPSEQD